MEAIPLQAVLLVIHFVMAGVTALLAYRKNRHPLLWFGLGLFLGVLALALALLMGTARAGSKNVGPRLGKSKMQKGDA